jgi:hypothetical protein
MTLDHTTAFPGNQQQLLAFANNNGCLPLGFGTQGAAEATWMPVTKVGPFGTVTCVNPVNGPVTITATTRLSGKTLTGKATIACQ